MGIFKQSAEKLRANAMVLIGGDEQIQAMTVGTIGGTVSALSKRRFLVAATERNIYVIAFHRLGNTKLTEITETIPLAGATAEKTFLAFKINDMELVNENFWKKDSLRLIEYIQSQGAPVSQGAAG